MAQCWQSMDQLVSTTIGAAIPTIAVILALVRNESSISALSTRINNLEVKLDARIENLSGDLSARMDSLAGRVDHLENELRLRIETLDRDLREWARITMQHNTDIARLKYKTGLE